MPPGFGPTLGNATLDGAFTAYPFMKLHIGQPGANGTSNPAVNTTRVDTTGKMAAAAAGSKASNASLDWTAVAASETYTHCSFWTAGSGGTFGFSGTVTANPVSSGDNFSIPATQLVAAVNLAS